LVAGFLIAEQRINILNADRILTLDIGADGIRMAVVADPGSSSPRIVDFGFAAFDSSLSLPKEAITAMTLKQLLDEKKPGIRRAAISVEGQAVFSRLVKLPLVGKDQMEKTIRHEAVQNIPFPLEEVVWDAHVFDPESEEPEVLLVAVKADWVDGLVHAVKANELTIQQITGALAALANAAHVFCNTSKPLLMVDGGEASTNLVFVDGRRVFFRSAPISGHDVDRREQEIERSIAFYSGQQEGNAPRQILDSAEMDGVEPGFAVCLGLACSSTVSIDLIPPSLVRENDRRKRQPFWCASVGLLILILAVWIVNLNIRTEHSAMQLVDVKGQVAALRALENQLLPIEKRIKGLNQQAKVYEELLDDRSAWLKVLAELHAVLPDGMFLTDSEPIRQMDQVTGTRISVVSYLDREAEGEDPVKLLRDQLRESLFFSDQTKVFSRPSKKEFAREFVLDVYFAEVPQ